MGKRDRSGLWMLLVLMLVLLFSVPVSATPVSEHGALSVSGNSLVDANGRAVQLKGVSTHGLAWFPEYISKEAFKGLRDDWGANAVRLALYTEEYGGYCSNGSKSQLKEKIQEGVQAATDLGMYVIIDWHVLSDQNPNKHKNDAITFFREMAEKYKNQSNVLYEICNEPNGGTSWTQVKSYAEAVIKEIRAIDANAIILIGTPTWSQDVDIAAKNPIWDGFTISSPSTRPICVIAHGPSNGISEMLVEIAAPSIAVSSGRHSGSTDITILFKVTSLR